MASHYEWGRCSAALISTVSTPWGAPHLHLPASLSIILAISGSALHPIDVQGIGIVLATQIEIGLPPRGSFQVLVLQLDCTAILRACKMKIPGRIT
jgi:hypothetical protein